MTNKKKTFFNKLLLATSSIGLLASMGCFAADIIPAGNPSSNIGTMKSHYLPQDNDNIIIAENNHRINFAQTLTIRKLKGQFKML
ncbi:hypothetical protein [Rickettsia montanensis]|uniref:Uncharacterized protein n=1 Tax=Rickettsia montanensis (strain OSU 85-930) TaxID=1105114 RepID=H8KBC7_RICMS|nr:hypothetical protein [Rickettsia montanensis]AFC73718.1 hypothetical protein MCI_04390 [Rickettsia montanensis str. OSU 85-930]